MKYIAGERKIHEAKKSGYIAGQEMAAFLDVTLVNDRFTALIFFSSWTPS